MFNFAIKMGKDCFAFRASCVPSSRVPAAQPAFGGLCTMEQPPVVTNQRQIIMQILQEFILNFILYFFFQILILNFIFIFKLEYKNYQTMVYEWKLE